MPEQSDEKAQFTTGHAWRDGRCVNCDAETGRPWAEPCPGTEKDQTVYERFIAEVEALTIGADMPAAAVVGELTRAVKRAQNSWDADDGEANPAMCACGHGVHLHEYEDNPPYCMIHEDNTYCDYAPPVVISADRWDEGWIACANALTPAPLEGGARVLWALDHMPDGNPYREASEGAADRMWRKFAEFVRDDHSNRPGTTP